MCTLLTSAVLEGKAQKCGDERASRGQNPSHCLQLENAFLNCRQINPLAQFLGFNRKNGAPRPTKT